MTPMIPPDYTALEREQGPCALHDHFGQGECPDCEVRRKLADALALAASLQDEIERLKEAVREDVDARYAQAALACSGSANKYEWLTASQRVDAARKALALVLLPETGAP